MKSKEETLMINRIIGAIARYNKLNKSHPERKIVTQRMHMQSSGGVPDYFYDTPAGTVQVEYKFRTEKFPRVSFTAKLSPKQRQYFTERLDTGAQLYCITGYRESGEDRFIVQGKKEALRKREKPNTLMVMYSKEELISLLTYKV